MVLEKRWLFSIGNGAEIRPLEKGRKCSVMTYNNKWYHFMLQVHFSRMEYPTFINWTSTFPFKDICGYFQCAPFPRLQTGKVVWVLSFDP